MKLDGVFVYVSFWLFLLLRICETVVAEKSCILSEGKVKFPDSHIIVTYSRYSIPMAHEDVIRYDYMRRMDKEHVKSYERRFIVEDKDKKNRTASSKTINKNTTRPTSASAAKRSVITKSHWREVNQELNFTEDATLDLMWYAKKYVNLTNFARIIKPTIRQLYESKAKELKSKRKEGRKLKKGKIKKKKRRKRYVGVIDSLLSAFKSLKNNFTRASHMSRNMSEHKILQDISDSKILRNSSERKIWKFLRANSESKVLGNTSNSRILKNTSDWQILRNTSGSQLLRNASDWKITSQRKIVRNTSNISLKIEKTWKIINAINNRTIIDPTRKHGTKHNNSVILTNKTFNYTVPSKYRAIAKMNPPIWRKLQVVKHTIKANLKLLKHPGNLSEHKPFKDVLVSDIFLLRRFEGYILHEIDAILKSKNMSLLGNSTGHGGGNASTNSINATRNNNVLLRNNATNVTQEHHATPSNGTLVCFKLSIQPKKVLRRLGWKVKLKEYQIIIGTPQDETNIPLCVVNKDLPKISAPPPNKKNKAHKKGKKKKKSKNKSRKPKRRAKSQEKGDRTKRGTTNPERKQKDVKQKNNVHKYGSKLPSFSARDVIAKREDYMKAKYYGERGQMLDQGSSVCVRVVS